MQQRYGRQRNSLSLLNYVPLIRFGFYSYNVTPLSLLPLKQNKRRKEAHTHTWVSLDTHT